jgi:hypothetical protein
MAVEAATKISELNKLWPLGTDPRSEGDDHIRLIKSVLQSTDGGALVKVTQTVLTTSGTYTKPAGLKFLDVTVIGGGGGSTGAPATAAGQSAAGGGGGGGGTVNKLYAAAAIGATEAYVIGAAGAASPGAAGGTSTFSGLTGGGGGGASTGTGVGTTYAASSRGLGGSATGGDLNLSGGLGGFGLRCVHGTTSAIGGDGGGTVLTPHKAGNTAATGINGLAGAFPGGGAVGGLNGPSQAVANGAVGGAGCIILREYF